MLGRAVEKTGFYLAHKGFALAASIWRCEAGRCCSCSLCCLLLIFTARDMFMA